MELPLNLVDDAERSPEPGARRTNLFNLSIFSSGIFANGHLMYEFERDNGPEGMPSIVDMTEAAIKVLRKNNDGFFLMVPTFLIHHNSRAYRIHTNVYRS